MIQPEPHEFLLHDKQLMALTSPADEILFGGAAGGAKSHLLRVAAILAVSAAPMIQVYLFRRTYTDLWKNHMDGPNSLPVMLDPWLKTGYAAIKEGKNQIVFGHKQKIHLCHCQYEKDKLKYQGAEIHVLLMDELTHFTVTIYKYLRSRVRAIGLKIPQEIPTPFPRIICGSNPGGTGHNWVKHEFIDIAPPMALTRMPKKEGGMLRQFIPALLEDNPSMAEDDPDYETRLEGLGSPELVKAMRYGLWDIIAGGALDDVWSREKHVIAPFKIPRSWYVDRSFDWGSSAPYSVGFWAESDGTEVKLSDGSKRTFPRGTLFRIAELYGWNGEPNTGIKATSAEIARDTTQSMDALKPLIGNRRPMKGPADTSIFDVINGSSIASEMETAGVVWDRANKGAGTRVAGLELLRGRLKASLQEPQEEPGLFIFGNCTQFIRTVPVLPRDERNQDDVDSGAEDHVYDDTRYRLLKKKIITTSQGV